MTTKVFELATGFVGTVYATVDEEKVAVADTRAYKSYQKAERAAKRLALYIVKNGISN